MTEGYFSRDLTRVAILLFFESPTQHGQENFWEHWKRLATFWGNCQDFWEHSKRVVTFWGIWADFCGSSTCSRIPRYSFFYLSDSQIWLNLLLANRYFWSKMRKLRKKTYFFAMFEKIFSKEKKGRMLPSSARCFWWLRIAKRL